MDIANYIRKSMSYAEYWQFFEGLVEDGKTNFPEPGEDKVHFTKLNLHRSRRVHKKFKPHDELESALLSMEEPVTWLAIVEPWCGDAAQNLPVFDEISRLSKNIDLRVVLRDENPELMDRFLTNGTRSIPKIVQLDPNMNVMSTWGPRPEILQSMVPEIKKNPLFTKELLQQEIQNWYNRDMGKTLQMEIISMIRTFVNA